MAAAKGPILILHDTTEFSFQRDKPDAIGKTRVLPASRIGNRPITKCGLLMHSSLAITPHGMPLGLTAIKFWTRKKFKGTNALKKKDQCATRVPIEQKESIRWLENLEQSTAVRRTPIAAFISAIARATSTSCSAWPRRKRRIFWYGPASIGWPERAAQRSPGR